VDHVRATLPRRVFLGARLAADDGDAFGPDGARIDGVIDGGVAAAAGVIAGDVLRALDGAPVRSMAELAAALRTEATELALDLVRAGTPMTLRAPRLEAAREEATYGQLDVPGARLRTIVTAGDADLVILVVPGIACTSVETGPLAALAQAWARAGLASLRFDRRGVGDSDGGACGDVDLATELADQRLALARARTLAARVVVFGHSVGGMTAALLAADGVDGVIVYGTSPVRWLDCVTASQRRQGVDDEPRLAALRARILADGASGRSAAYHAQLDALDLPAAWRAVTAPTLVLHGEHDWVVGEDEARRIPGEVAIVPGLDHLLGWHPDRASSLREYGAGRDDDTVAALTTGWVRALRSPP